MNISKSKGIKPFTIKAIIVIMSFLYVLGPAHLEIKKLMHTLVHTFEMPNTILSHKNSTNDVKIHQEKKHEKLIVNHNHVVIDLVGEILKTADNRNNTPETIQTTYKIDKHNRNFEDDSQNDLIQISVENKTCFYQSKNKICKGYLKGLKKPPKL